MPTTQLTYQQLRSLQSGDLEGEFKDGRTPPHLVRDGMFHPGDVDLRNNLHKNSTHMLVDLWKRVRCNRQIFGLDNFSLLMGMWDDLKATGSEDRLAVAMSETVGKNLGLRLVMN